MYHLGGGRVYRSISTVNPADPLSAATRCAGAPSTRRSPPLRARSSELQNPSHAEADGQVRRERGRHAGEARPAHREQHRWSRGRSRGGGCRRPGGARRAGRAVPPSPLGSLR